MSDKEQAFVARSLNGKCAEFKVTIFQSWSYHDLAFWSWTSVFSSVI